MKIVCIGGGPAGLYFALLMKKRGAHHDITVVERNKPYDTFGWGVVFSDQTMEHMRHWDAETAQEVQQAFNHWDDIELHFKGRVIRSGGHGFVGINTGLVVITGHKQKVTGCHKRMRCCPLVTAGSFPTFALTFPTRVLINVDFPTLGIPIITALICFPFSSLLYDSFGISILGFNEFPKIATTIVDSKTDLNVYVFIYRSS